MSPLRLPIVALAALVAAPLLCAAPEFKAGAAIADITPEKLPSPINGSMKGAFARNVTDPMHARALALHDGRHELILCVVDACMIPREVCEAAKAIAAQATGVPPAHLLISATHSHSCATMTAVFQSDPDPAYVAAVPARIAQALIRAHANLEPAEIAWGRENEPNQVFNRRWLLKPDQTVENPLGGTADGVLMNPGYNNARIEKPAAPTDPEVAILAARAKAGKRPIALLANYSLHYVGGSPAISADYFGAFAREVAERLGGDARFVAAMSNGTSGDINNLNYAGPPPPRRAPGEQIDVVARSVAEAALRAWRKLDWKPHAPLASAERDVSLGVRRAAPAELARARQVLATAPREPDGQFSDRRAIYARETVLLADYPPEVPVKLQAHRIGGLTIAAIPCEVFVEIGLDLKARKRLEQHFTISLANGYNGYLPTPAHHALGGYETWRARSSYLEVAAATKITAQLDRLLDEVAK